MTPQPCRHGMSKTTKSFRTFTPFESKAVSSETYPGSNQRKTTNDCAPWRVFIGDEQDLPGAERCRFPITRTYSAAMGRLLLEPSKLPSIANLKFRLYADNGLGKDPRLVVGSKASPGLSPTKTTRLFSVAYCQSRRDREGYRSGDKKSPVSIADVDRKPRQGKADFPNLRSIPKFYATPAKSIKAYFWTGREAYQ